MGVEVRPSNYLRLALKLVDKSKNIDEVKAKIKAAIESFEQEELKKTNLEDIRSIEIHYIDLSAKPKTQKQNEQTGSDIKEG